MKDTQLEQLSRNSWLHFYPMEDVKRSSSLPRFLSKGDGVYVWDQDGRKLIDGISGTWCVNVGYGRHRIVNSAKQAADQIHFTSPFMVSNPWAIELANKLSKLAQNVVGKDARVFFVNSGSEGNDTAIKIARAYHRRKGDVGRYKVVSRNSAYHGTTMGALSAGGFAPMKFQFEPLLPGFSHIPHTLCSSCEMGLSSDSCGTACAKIACHKLNSLSPNTVAAILLEPCQENGGVIPPPPGYLDMVTNTARNNGALVIFDEVITGFGRLGYWFGSELYGMTADMLVCAKGLTSGYESLGAVIVKREIADVFGGSYEMMFAHGSTFGGRPSACAAALENIAIIEDENLLSESRKRSVYLRNLLEKNISNLPMVKEIRGEGLLFGIDVCDSGGALLDNPEQMLRFHERLCSAGLLCSTYVSITDPTFELAPPLIVTEEQCEHIVDVVKTALNEIIPNS